MRLDENGRKSRDQEWPEPVDTVEFGLRSLLTRMTCLCEEEQAADEHDAEIGYGPVGNRDRSL